jgi:hypothetical protein
MIRTKRRNSEIQSHGTFRVGSKVLAVLPPDDLSECRRDEVEVVTITRFAPGKDSIIRARVANDDGVGCWIKLEMIVRHA